MNHFLKPLTISTLLILASATATATQTSIEPILDKSDAITMAMNFAKVQPYEAKKVDVNNYVVTDIKDLNGMTRSYEVSLFNISDDAVGYINIPNRTGFDAVSNYAFQGTSKTQKLQQDFARQIELAELATGNTAFFVGSELGAIAIAVKLDGNQLNASVSNYHTIGDYAVFSRLPKKSLTPLTKTVDTVKEINSRSAEGVTKVDLTEETELRQKLLTGDTNIESLENNNAVKTKTLDMSYLSRSYSSGASVVEGNSVGGQPMNFGETDYKGYNQYLISKDQNADKSEWCYTGCTPTAYTVILDYWDRKQFPNLIGGSENREQNTIQSGGYYGYGDDKYYVDGSEFNDHDLDLDAFNTILKLRKHLGTACDAATPSYNIWKGEKYIKEMGYDAKVKRTSGLFKNQRSFNKLKQEIDAGRPAIIGMTLDGTWGGGHSAVAYGYRDAPGTEHDIIYIIIGFGDKTGNFIKRNSHISTTSVEISELPSKNSATAVEAAPQSFWQKLMNWFNA